MKWKTLLQTIVFSILLFFIVIYLGMKFEWVQALKDKKAQEEASLALVIPKKTPVTPQASTVSDAQKQLGALDVNKKDTVGDSALTASVKEDTLDDETLDASVSVKEDTLDDATFNDLVSAEEDTLDDDVLNALAGEDTLDDTTLNPSASLVQEDTLAETEEKHSETLSLESNNAKEGNKLKASLVEKKVSNKEESRRVVKPTKEEKKRVVTPVKEEKKQDLKSTKENNNPRVVPSLGKRETQSIDFSGMSLERVVAECRRLSNKIGVPQERLNQSVNECATRNFQGQATKNARRSRNIKITLRKQCKAKIPPEQRVLFSREEMQLLIDECVADLRRKKE